MTSVKSHQRPTTSSTSVRVRALKLEVVELISCICFIRCHYDSSVVRHPCKAPGIRSLPSDRLGLLTLDDYNKSTQREPMFLSQRNYIMAKLAFVDTIFTVITSKYI